MEYRQGWPGREDGQAAGKQVQMERTVTLWKQEMGRKAGFGCNCETPRIWVYYLLWPGLPVSQWAKQMQYFCLSVAHVHPRSFSRLKMIIMQKTFWSASSKHLSSVLCRNFLAGVPYSSSLYCFSQELSVAVKRQVCPIWVQIFAFQFSSDFSRWATPTIQEMYDFSCQRDCFSFPS